MKNSDLFRHEDDFLDLSPEDATKHLSDLLRFRTVGSMNKEEIDYAPWEALQAYLKVAYPLVAQCATWETIGHSLLIHLKGQDPNLKPALFMAHQDVVPVIPGTEDQWLHDPFSGDVADGFIWGRGSLDIKEMLIGIMESAEYWLRRGAIFQRSVYLAFGEDEETRSEGARRIAQTLASRGVELAFVLDEGAGDVMDAADYGAPGELVCSIGVYEKGYADMQLSVHAQGGHSSNPFHGTSLGKLSKAIASILATPPQSHLSDAVIESLELLKDVITEEPLKSWVRDIPGHTEEILQYMQTRENLYHQIQTTVAPTMISGGAPAGNVMPGDMQAVINFRLSPPDTPESLLKDCQALVGEDVQCAYVQCIGPSIPSDTKAFGYLALKETLEHYFDRLIFIPQQNKGATDARAYEGICRCVLRFGPFLEEEDISHEGIHGTNERISVRAFMQGIRVLAHFMNITCIQGKDLEA